MENAQRAGQGQVAAASPPAPTTPAAEPAAITYGSKPVMPAAAAPPPQVASLGIPDEHLDLVRPVHWV
jgi:hypothetical protein